MVIDINSIKTNASISASETLILEDILEYDSQNVFGGDSAYIPSSNSSDDWQTKLQYVSNDDVVSYGAFSGRNEESVGYGISLLQIQAIVSEARSLGDQGEDNTTSFQSQSPLSSNSASTSTPATQPNDPKTTIQQNLDISFDNIFNGLTDGINDEREIAIISSFLDSINFETQETDPKVRLEKWFNASMEEEIAKQIPFSTIKSTLASTPEIIQYAKENDLTQAQIDNLVYVLSYATAYGQKKDNGEFVPEPAGELPSTTPPIDTTPSPIDTTPPPPLIQPSERQIRQVKRDLSNPFKSFSNGINDPRESRAIKTLLDYLGYQSDEASLTTRLNNFDSELDPQKGKSRDDVKQDFLESEALAEYALIYNLTDQQKAHLADLYVFAIFYGQKRDKGEAN